VIQETELTLFVPSPELLVKLASGDHPLGLPAGPPHITVLRETYLDTEDHALRRRGMTCKLRQVEGEDPDLVVTVGEGPDSEGITSRTRLTASAVGFGVFETLRGDSEAAHQIRKFVEPAHLRARIALDIQRLGRVYRSPVLRRPILLLFFDRITVQAGTSSTVFHELRLRRRRKGGPSIRAIAQELRDRFHLFPDGLSTLQRAYRILDLEQEGRPIDPGLSPYALSLALAIFREGRIGLLRRGNDWHIPTFRGSGEDAARALSSDLLGSGEKEILRLGSTEPRVGRPMLEVWAMPDPGLAPDDPGSRHGLAWIPWHRLMEEVGGGGLRQPALLSALLLLSRRRLLGQVEWVPRSCGAGQSLAASEAIPPQPPVPAPPEPEVAVLSALVPILREVEDRARPLRERLRAASELTRGLSRFFLAEVASTKGRALSQPTADDAADPLVLLDILSIRVRGMMDRLYTCLQEDLQPGLEASGIHVRSWSGLMREDRRVLLEAFTASHLPSLQVAAEWGPSFIPEMPPVGCAVGLSARGPAGERTRFFHVVLADHTPSFLNVPGTTTVVPLEEVVRGYFFARDPELERVETHLFRFTTSEVAIREPVLAGETPGAAPREGDAPAVGVTGGARPEEPVAQGRRSVMVRVLVRKEMSEMYQAHLIRALERQVSRKTPLIGWSDIFPVAEVLDLGGVDELLDLKSAAGV
jgi:hypothetical protein